MNGLVPCFETGSCPFPLLTLRMMLDMFCLWWSLLKHRIPARPKAFAATITGKPVRLANARHKSTMTARTTNITQLSFQPFSKSVEVIIAPLQRSIPNWSFIQLLINSNNSNSFIFILPLVALYICSSGECADTSQNP